MVTKEVKSENGAPWLEHLFLDVVNPFVYRFLGKELLRAKPAINEEPGDKLHADAILG